LVHATDTIAVCHLNFDEAVVAPPTAPGVLDDPVRNARVIKAPCIRFHAAVPPLVDNVGWRVVVTVTIAVAIAVAITVTITVAVAIITVALVAKLIADNYHGVIQLGAASISLLQDSAAISAEVAGTEGDVQWLLGGSFNHIVYRVMDPLIVVNLADDFVVVMEALLELLCFILVVRFSHCTVVLQEFEMIFHPAATAAPATVVLVVFSKVLFVVLTTSIIGQCAVNTLLFGDTPRI